MKFPIYILRAAKTLLVSYLTAFLVLGLFAQPGAAQQRRPQQQKYNVAVMDFNARSGISEQEAATLSDAFQAELAGMQDFVLVDRQRIRQILEEQGFQQSEACSQVECIVEAGKILKVDRMFAGTIGKVGQVFNVSIQSIDVSTAQIVSNRNAQHRGEIEELLTEIIPDIARQMAADLTGREYVAEGGGGWLWWLLGTVVLGGGGAAAFLLLKPDPPPPPTESAAKLPDSPSFPQ